MNNHNAILEEITRFESVHPSIYALYDLVEDIKDRSFAQKFRNHIMKIENSFVNNQEWTLPHSICEIKIGLLGLDMCGKAALVYRYLTGKYTPENSSDGGRYKKEVFVNDEPMLLLLREEIGPPESQFCEWIDGVIFVFSLDNVKSYHTVQEYYKRFMNGNNFSALETPVVLVGILDYITPENPRKINDVHIRILAESLNAYAYFETSAQYGINIDNMFQSICMAVVEKKYGKSNKNICNDNKVQIHAKSFTDNHHKNTHNNFEKSPTFIMKNNNHIIIEEKIENSLAVNKTPPFSKNILPSKFSTPSPNHVLNSEDSPSQNTTFTPTRLHNEQFRDTLAPIIRSQVEKVQANLTNLHLNSTTTDSPSSFSDKDDWDKKKIGQQINSTVTLYNTPSNAKNMTNHYSSLQNYKYAGKNLSINSLFSTTTSPPAQDITLNNPKMLKHHPNNGKFASENVNNHKNELITDNKLGLGLNVLSSPPKKSNQSTSISLHSDCKNTYSQSCKIPTPIKQGWLYKKSVKTPLNKEWKRKWVTLLNNGILIYHSNIQDYINAYNSNTFTQNSQNNLNSETEILTTSASSGVGGGKEINLLHTTVKVPAQTQEILTSNSNSSMGGSSFIFSYPITTSTIGNHSRMNSNSLLTTSLIVPNATFTSHHHGNHNNNFDKKNTTDQIEINSRLGKDCDNEQNIINSTSNNFTTGSLNSKLMMNLGQNSSVSKSLIKRLNTHIASALSAYSPLNTSTTNNTINFNHQINNESSNDNFVCHATNLLSNVTPSQHNANNSTNTTTTIEKMTPLKRNLTFDTNSLQSSISNRQMLENCSNSNNSSSGKKNCFVNHLVASNTTPLLSRKKHKRNRSGENANACEFIIISADGKQWHFDAPSIQERQEWVKAIEEQILQGLSATISFNSAQERRLMTAPHNSSETHSSQNDNFGNQTSTLSPENAREIKAIPGNDKCVDCGTSDPEWASLNLGALVCIGCSGIHRNLGVHISKIRSLQLDDWPMEYLAVMKGLGNNICNAIFEYHIKPEEKPSPQTSREDKEIWIRSKYQTKQFLRPLPFPTSQLMEHLMKAIRHGDIPQTFLYLTHSTMHKDKNNTFDSNNSNINTDKQHFACEKSLDFNINALFDYDNIKGGTLLHLAVISGNVAIIQLLLWHDANPNTRDKNGHLPIEIAEKIGFLDSYNVLCKRMR